MEHSHEQYKIKQLLIRLVENEINDEDVKILNDWFSKNADAVNEYCEFLRDYAIIRLRVSSEIDSDISSGDSQFDRAVWAALKEVEDTAPVIDIQAELPFPPRPIEKIERSKIKRQIPKNAFITAIVSLAAMLLIVLFIQFAPVKSSKPVASVTAAYNANWNGGEGEIPTGSRLWNDWHQYQLERGVAEITFDSGATVLLEAPVQFQLLNENEMSVEGSLTAFVPISAHGFTVHTSRMTVVDLGTEFGVSADATGSQVQVLKGQVELTLDTSEKSLKSLVQAGEGYRVDPSGALHEVPFQPGRFRWESPDSYEQAVYETKPVCYWRFDRDTFGRMYNEMNLHDSRSHYQGRVWLDAPGPNLGAGKPNNALRLFGIEEGVKDVFPAGYGIIAEKQEVRNRTSAYSIALWVYPESFGVQSIIFSSDESLKSVKTLDSYSDQIYLNDKNQLSFYVYCSLSAESSEALQSISTSDEVRLNTWYHVVAAYSQDGMMKLYVNGKLKAAKQLPSMPDPYPLEYIGCATINPFYGNDASENDSSARKPFTGVVDEISEYNRELSAQEVKRLYDAAIAK